MPESHEAQNELPGQNRPPALGGALPADIEQQRLAFEYYKARLDYRKFLLGSVFVAIAIATIPPLFQLATAVLEYVKTRQQLKIDVANTNAERLTKQQTFRDEYVKTFLNNGLSQDIELRIRFADYFAHVATDSYKDSWADYHADLVEQRDTIRADIHDKEAELLRLEKLDNDVNAAKVDRLRRELEWAYKEVGYVEKDRSVATNPRSPGQPRSSETGPHRPIMYSEEIVKRIQQKPGVPYPTDRETRPGRGSIDVVKGIVLHTADGPDSVLALLRDGRPDLPGPLAHWVVLSGGSIQAVAAETQRVNHVGVADRGLANSNTIGIEATGVPAFSDERQVENLIRLVADLADRLDIPTAMIVSHAEIALPPGRRSDMLQQAPAVRQMVDQVRKKKM